MNYFSILFLLLALFSCRERHQKVSVSMEKQSNISGKYPDLKIFIEDGGSMKGFFQDPNFAFSSDLSKLYGNLQSSSKKLDLILNEDLKPLVHNNELEFSQYLSNLNKHGRFKGESSFEKMLNLVLQSDSKNTVTAFVSDYIQSSEDLTNNIAGDYISTLLSKKLKENNKFSVCVLKMKSRFKGDFYYVSQERKDVIPNPESIDKEKPYYVWFFGDNEAFEKLKLNHANITSMNLKGFVDFSIYNEKTYDEIDNKINWTILQFTNPIGTFKPARNGKVIEGVHDIVNVKPDRETNEFQICVGIDLSKIPVSDGYKIDTNNYTIESNGFKIEQISKLNGTNYDFMGKGYKIDSKDLKLLSKVNPTHLLFLKSKSKVVDNVEISFKRNISPELLQSNSDDESKLMNLKTYGFRNFTDAIKTSFPIYNETSYYFTKKVNVENKKGGFSWLMVVAILGVIGVIVFIVFKNKK